MSNLRALLPATAMTLFVHFKNEATGEKLYVMEMQDVEGVPTAVQKLDGEGKAMPIGVMVYTPGSKVYRTAANMNATDNIKAGRKELSGDKIDQQQVNLLARTTIRPVNFDLDGGNNFDAWREFYDNGENVAYREQVAEAQADLGKSLIASVKG